MTGINIGAFPKIFTVGHRNVINIFEQPVEVTEKVDGSQFAFGKDMEGKLHIRSKGALIDIENPPTMFQEGVDYALSIQDVLPDDRVFYCEYLQKPKHNVLTYGRIPKNHLVLFGCSDFCRTTMVSHHSGLQSFANRLGIDVIPLLYSGYVASKDQVMEMIERDSFLGNAQIEGVVMKNYHQSIELNGQVYPVVTAKYVSEAFKEVHRDNWKKDHTTHGGWGEFVQQYNAIPRWEKAIQRMAEQELLTHSPKDIGPLIKEINNDISDEEKDTIKDFLWKTFSKDLYRVATRGFPQWYKERLLAESFDMAEVAKEDIHPRTLVGDK